MARPTPQSEKRILLVEGQDDKHVVFQLCERHPSFSVKRAGGNEYGVLQYKETLDVFISDKDGFPNLLSSISREIRVSGRQTLGIVMDANSNLQARWNQIRECLIQGGIQSPPTAPDPAGTIIPEQDFQPRIGIWLMPDNESPGELEDFIMKFIPDDDAVWPSSQRYIEGIPASDRKFTKIDKAKLHAWLATRRTPGRMGAAIGAGDLRVDGVLCQKFIAWLEKLFG